VHASVPFREVVFLHPADQLIWMIRRLEGMPGKARLIRSQLER
jgi:hypothetical protein